MSPAESLNNAKLMMMFAAVENRGLDVSVLGVTGRHVIFEVKPTIDPNLPVSLKMQIQQSRGYLLCAMLTSRIVDSLPHLQLGPWLWVEGSERQRRVLEGRENAWVRAYWPEPAVDLFSLVLQHYYLATAEGDASIPVVEFCDGTPVEAEE